MDTLSYFVILKMVKASQILMGQLAMANNGKQGIARSNFPVGAPEVPGVPPEQGHPGSSLVLLRCIKEP